MSAADLVFEAGRAVAGVIVDRADSWVNALTGLGTLRDKLTHAQKGPNLLLSDATLEHLYNGDSIAAKICDKIPREATRRGFCIELEGLARDESARTARDIEQAARRMAMLPALRQAWIWGRLYGGGAAFIGADDGLPMDLPLLEERIATIRFFLPVAKPQISIFKRYEDPDHPKHGLPELYEVRRAPALSMATPVKTGTYIHESRLVMFGGNIGARFFSMAPDGFDDSVLQRVHTELRDTATAWASTGHLLTDASQGVLKIKGLMGMVASGGKDKLHTRVELMDMARSVCRSLLLDADGESFERLATSFASIPELMDRFMMRTAAAAEMPVTILWGRSPAGMNATGENDVRGWYDTVEDAQTDVLQPRLERALTLLMLAKDGPTKGKLPDNWAVKFRPLWQPTAAEEATRRKTVADTFVALVGAQIMGELEAGLGLANEFPTLNVEVRQKALEDELKKLEQRAAEPDPEPPGPGDDPDDEPDDEA